MGTNKVKLNFELKFFFFDIESKNPGTDYFQCNTTPLLCMLLYSDSH